MPGLTRSTILLGRTVFEAPRFLSLSRSWSSCRGVVGRGYGCTAASEKVIPGVGRIGRGRGNAVGGTNASGRRSIHSSAVRRHGDIKPPAPGEGILIHFQSSTHTPLKSILASPGDDILSLAHFHDIDLEGACEGSVACSTCHVILPLEYYEKLPEPEDDENDMLDMAFGLTETSRLGCQVKVTKELDGMTCTLPSATRNMFVDGVKPTKH